MTKYKANPHTHTLAHMETLLQQGLKLAKGFVCVCVCVLGQSANCDFAFNS